MGKESREEAGRYVMEALTAPAELPVEERPRERLVKHGPEALSDQELLAILLNTGIRGKNVAVLSGELLERLEQSKRIPTVKELAQMTGLGVSKAGAVVAMLEFGRRRWGVTGARIDHPSDAFSLVRHYANRKQEYFICISLNGAHEALAVRVITVGLVNRTIVHPREVFADALGDRACAIICAHNHPSGMTEPSREDDAVTESLKCAADVLGINFLDHLIFTDGSYFSYCQANRLNGRPTY
ncbi:MAG: DNA repair protein RadC [Treponema sp.]|jgi:DNA repair protein RadC|nr:DNA repair protein RadC [Treponema sp.]